MYEDSKDDSTFFHSTYSTSSLLPHAPQSLFVEDRQRFGLDVTPPPSEVQSLHCKSQLNRVFFFSVDVQVPSMLHVLNEIDLDVKITESGQCQSVCSPSDQVGSALCLFALDLLLTCFDLTCF